MLQPVADVLSERRRAGRGLVCLALVLILLAGCSSRGFNPSTASAPEQAEIERERPQPEPLTVAQKTRLNKAEAAARADNPEVAIANLEALRDARPYFAGISARLGLLYQQMGRESQAIAAYRRAISDDPGEPLALNNLALLYQKNGRFADARELLEAGVKWHPQSPAMHYNLAILAELYLLDLPLALHHYQQYQSLAPEPREAVAGWIADLERRVN